MADAAKPPATPERSGGRVRSFLLGARRFHLVVIAVLIVVAVALQAWKMVVVHGLEDDLVAQRTALLAQSRHALETQTTDLLRLSATPLGWAIRSAMLTNASADIDAYMAKLIQSKYVKRVALVDPTGKVIAATDLKLKGQLVGVAFPGTSIDTTEPRVEHLDDVTRVVVPVMDFTRQIGTLIYDYSDESINRHFESPGIVR
ncbi:MAG: hypothetical protein ABI467_16825 [Kofleriaceae bacterium]